MKSKKKTNKSKKTPKKVKSTNKIVESKDIPIDDFIQAKNDFITKPFDQTELLKITQIMDTELKKDPKNLFSKFFNKVQKLFGYNK